MNNFNIKGLTAEQVLDSRNKNGKNLVVYTPKNTIIEALKSFLKDPMVMLLLVGSAIYFVSGDTGNGIFLIVAIFLVSAISMFQNSRSKNALEKLKDLSQPKCKVIREEKILEIKSEDLVIGDSLLLEEGTSISADGVIVHSHDFSVNEAILTGESFAIEKDQSQKDALVYQGTAVATGLAIATITAIGGNTKLGKIGKSITNIKEEKTPLESQINAFVKNMAGIGVLVFIVVWSVNYFYSHKLLDSLLQSLTLAMSILPQEIPVAFTTFMALGAWRMMEKGILVKQMKTVETLGSATVICTDKTGTITENKMKLAKLYTLNTNLIEPPEGNLTKEGKEIIELAMWASEPIPFDPMEIALHEAYSHAFSKNDRSNYSFTHEYPLSGTPPMMTHVFEDQKGDRIIACKGAVEAVIKLSNLTKIEIDRIMEAVSSFSIFGYRVLGVAESNFKGENFPKTQQELPFLFKGLVAFYDPPKKNIQDVLEDFYKAGISVKIITGDNLETTKAIAKQVGFREYEHAITGDDLMALSGEELKKKVIETKIFARMFPDAKLKIINILKANNQIIAMIGDGVNDGPALKAAHIGIAMGKKGSEIAKEAASLILMNDDLSKMVDAIGMGRRIYANLKKAIQFIISIHVPIILTVFIPLVLGWVYPNIFSPLHIIFLELIMGPTCSIVYENEPLEADSMLQVPRPYSTSYFSWKELSTSILQGLFITAGTLFIYQYSVQNNYNEPLTRTMVFTTLIMANVFLTLVNRSFYNSIFTTLRYKNDLIFMVITITLVITALLIYVPPISNFFELEQLSIFQIGVCFSVSSLSVFWIEGLKWRKRLIKRKQNEN